MAKRHGVTNSSLDLQTCFGRLVRHFRLRMGITQEELAWRADMHRTYIADIERGGRNITLANIGKIALALKVPAHRLLQEPQVEASAERRDAEILLVSADPGAAKSLVRTLLRAKSDARIHVVENADAALRYLKKIRDELRAWPRWLILKAGEPGAAGLVKRVARGGGKRSVAIAIVADSRRSPGVAECREAGAGTFLSLPLAVGAAAKLVGGAGSAPR